MEDSGDAGAPRVVSRKAPLVEEVEAIATGPAATEGEDVKAEEGWKYDIYGQKESGISAFWVAVFVVGH